MERVGLAVRVTATVWLSLLLLFPTYWMVAGSFQTLQGVLRVPPDMIPRTFTMGNYAALFQHNAIGRWAINTLGLSVGAVVVGVGTAAMAGYAFAVYRLPKWLFVVFVAALAVPRMAIVIPQFVTFRSLGIGQGVLGVLVPLWCYPAGVLLFRVQAEGLPKSLHDAAKIDGAGEWQIFTRLVLPLCTPAVGIMVIGKAFEAMGDYLWQSLVLTRKPEMTLIVGLVAAVSRRQDINVNPIGATLAAGVLMFLPMLAVFVVFQRSFKQSLLGGALKE